MILFISELYIQVKSWVFQYPCYWFFILTVSNPTSCDFMHFWFSLVMFKSRVDRNVQLKQSIYSMKISQNNVYCHMLYITKYIFISHFRPLSHIVTKINQIKKRKLLEIKTRQNLKKNLFLLSKRVTVWHKIIIADIIVAVADIRSFPLWTVKKFN